MIVLCPTRGRPDDAREVQVSFDATKTRTDTDLIFVVDEDDPRLDDYKDVGHLLMVYKAEGGNMVKALNVAANVVTKDPFDADIVGFIGDDHRFRTHGWDADITVALDRVGGGIAYADDLAQRQQLPTQVFMSARIITALGWMGLPVCRHLYIDNAWKVLGEGIGRLVYVPHVVIEHLHPAYGKGTWDEGHIRVNSAEMYSEDGAAFARWLHDGATDDIAKARAAL